MLQTPTKTLTLEEFLKLPETEPPSEYINGRLTSTPAKPRTGIPKPHDLGFCFCPLRGFAPALTDLLCSGLTVAPQTDTASPAAKIFFAALISRSWCAPQLRQSHSRIFNGNLETMCPHSKHRLELGNHRSILIKVRPYQSHLYSSCLTNSPQLASLIARANFRFLTIFFTAKFKGGDGLVFAHQPRC